MPRITLSIPTEIDGKQYEQGATVEVDRATRNNMVFLGRARDAETKPAPSADGKVK
jgi:hypothetical protein